MKPPLRKSCRELPAIECFEKPCSRMHAVKEVWWQKYRRRQYKRKRLSLEMILRRSAWETSREYISQCSIAGVKQICDPDIGIIQRMHAVKEVWWQKYRRRQYKRKRLSLEMILRRSAWETSREYISQCSIAGVKQICDPDIGIIQRMIWIILFVTMIASLFNVLCHTWMQTISSPLIVTMESSTHPISEIDFPAIALCNINRISKKALTAFANEIYKNSQSGGRHKIFDSGLRQPNVTFKHVYEYVLQLGNMFDYWWDENVKVDEHLDEIFSPANDTRKLIDLMRQLTPSCEDMLLKCAWAFEEVNCKDIFQVRRTSRGHCCAFNYILDYGSADRPNGTIANVRKQRLAGYLEGLNVILDPMVDDYAYAVSPSRGFEIFLFDPTHFADPNAGGRVIRRIVEPNQRVLLELQSVEQLATKEVRKYPIRTRKCLFHDEDAKKFGNLYSYSACIVSCKIKTINTLCKCIPFFLPTSEQDANICTLNELRCLNKYKEKLMYVYPTDALRTDGLEVELQDSLWCPECRPDCEFTQHFTRAFKGPITMAPNEFPEKELRLEFSLDINLTDKCFLSIYHPTSDGTLDRLDVISYWYEILSNVGGYAGILLGLSISSIVEILYFVIFRFPRQLYYNYTKYH